MVPKVHAGEGMLPIHVPSFWPVMCPLHIHQSTEAGDDLPQVMGIRIIIYLDNMLILAESPEQAAQHLEAWCGCYSLWGS